MTELCCLPAPVSGIEYPAQYKNSGGCHVESRLRKSCGAIRRTRRLRHRAVEYRTARTWRCAVYLLHNQARRAGTRRKSYCPARLDTARDTHGLSRYWRVLVRDVQGVEGAVGSRRGSINVRPDLLTRESSQLLNGRHALDRDRVFAVFPPKPGALVDADGARHGFECLARGGAVPCEFRLVIHERPCCILCNHCKEGGRIFLLTTATHPRC